MATFVDLSTTRTAISDDIADTPITDTSKPASPQYTYVVQAGDIPSTNALVSDFFDMLQVACSNTGTAARILNWRFTQNGVEIGTADNQLNVSGNRFCYMTGRFENVAPGDVLGIKLWGNGSGLNLLAAENYILPKSYSNATAFQTLGVDTVNAGTTGVNYSPYISVYPKVVDDDAGAVGIATAGMIDLIITPQQSLEAVTEDSNSIGANSNSAALTMSSIAGVLKAARIDPFN
jgi:hypothetical protein